MITDQQIIYDALRRYTTERQAFCNYAHHEGSLKENGEPFTAEEKADSAEIARRCDRLASIAADVLKDQQSSIIRVQ